MAILKISNIKFITSEIQLSGYYCGQPGEKQLQLFLMLVTQDGQDCERFRGKVSITIHQSIYFS